MVVDQGKSERDAFQASLCRGGAAYAQYFEDFTRELSGEPGQTRRMDRLRECSICCQFERVGENLSSFPNPAD